MEIDAATPTRPGRVPARPAGVARRQPHSRGGRVPGGRDSRTRAPSRSCAGGTGHWPTPGGRRWPGRSEYRGRDATVAEQLAYHEVMAEAEAPGPINVIGVANIAPAILEVGTQDQKDRFLAPHAAGRRDLVPGHVRARCRLRPGLPAHLGRARRRGVRGQRAEDLEQPRATMPIGASSTCAPTLAAQSTAGISCLLVDMRTPGIEVRPLRTMTGEVTFSEVFLHRRPGAHLLAARTAQRGVEGGHDHAQLRAGRGGQVPPQPERPLRRPDGGDPPQRSAR